MKKTASEGKGLPFFGVPKMLPFLAKYKKELIVMVTTGLASSGVDVLIPILQRYSLNHFVAERTLDTLPLFLIIYAAAVLIAGAVNYVSCSLATEVELSLDRDMRNRAFEHLQTLAFSYYNQNSVGYIHARVMSDTSRIGSLLSWTMLDATWHLTYIIGAIVVMLVINAPLALLVIAVIPVVAALFSVFQAKLIAVNRQVRELRGAFAAATNLASSMGLAIVLWRGGFIAESEVGTFSMFMSYAQGLMEPVRWIIDAISELITAQVNIERYTKLLETKSDVADTPEVTERYGDSFEPKRGNWEPIRGDIEFDDVSFKYPDGDEYVLEHFSLKIPFGMNLAIVGETGAGKSTLVNLVCRFFEPTSGRVLIDGRDARERSQLWLHSALGYVLQTPHLFSGTIRENLLYGNPDATEEQINEAIRLVSAESVISRLEKGLDTDVGEGGDLLSTGEKQLISFARVILADPRILVLDEATASVDTITEQKIQSAIDTIIRGRTSIVIAHRLSTVRNADLILVVRDGKIVEQGRHDELMRQRGAYYKLYTRQYEDESTGAILGGGRGV